MPEFDVYQCRTCGYHYVLDPRRPAVCPSCWSCNSYERGRITDVGDVLMRLLNGGDASEVLNPHIGPDLCCVCGEESCLSIGTDDDFKAYCSEHSPWRRTPEQIAADEEVSRLAARAQTGRSKLFEALRSLWPRAIVWTRQHPKGPNG